MLGNALKKYIEGRTSLPIIEIRRLAIEKFNIDYFTKRAEELTVRDYIKLDSFINSTFSKEG